MTIDQQIRVGIEAFQRHDFRRGLEILSPLATEGYATAQCVVGSAYQLGLGVEVDGPISVHWYTLAARQEVVDERSAGLACNNLATIYVTGLPGIEPNREMARDFYSKAARLNFNR